MSSSRVGEVALKSGSSPKCKWIFSKEEMRNMASLRDGLDEFKELQFRQQSTKFIQLLGDRLNQPLKDHRGKITQLCMCAAMIHMHRFFYFHSFTFFDYRDVAAACLFLSGKSEECPRKIDHILRAWWSEKFPGIKLDQQKYDDAMQLLVCIESVILQTIAFDLQVALPHPLVLKAMHSLAKNNRKITEVVYFFSTDVLCVTSWGIRYSAEAIAVACVHIVCTWADFEIPPTSEGYPWYHTTDPAMTAEQLQEMMREFIQVYKSCKNDLAITKFIRKGEIRDPISPGDLDRATPPALMDDMRLPPPPPPPLSLASKKVDINAYKERRAADSGSSHHHSSAAAAGHHQQQRRSFMPEMNQVKGVTASMPGFVPPKEHGGERKQHEFDSSHRSSSSSSSAQRPARPPSNGSSSGAPSSQHHHHHQQPQQQRHSSSSSSHHLQQQPSGSGMERQSMGGDRSRDAERERNEKRKREMSSSNLNSDKRSRTDMSGSGGPSQRGHSMLPAHSSSSNSQPQQGSYNSVPPPQPLLMQQPPPMHQGYGRPQQQHYSGGSQQHTLSNGHHQQQHRPSSGYGSQQAFQHQQQGGYPGQMPLSSGYGSHPSSGYGMQNGFIPPPPPPPPMATTGNDMEDGEVF